MVFELLVFLSICIFLTPMIATGLGTLVGNLLLLAEDGLYYSKVWLVSTFFVPKAIPLLCLEADWLSGKVARLSKSMEEELAYEAYLTEQLSLARLHSLTLIRRQQRSQPGFRVTRQQMKDSASHVRQLGKLLIEQRGKIPLMRAALSNLSGDLELVTTRRDSAIILKKCAESLLRAIEVDAKFDYEAKYAVAKKVEQTIESIECSTIDASKVEVISDDDVGKLDREGVEAFCSQLDKNVGKFRLHVDALISSEKELKREIEQNREYCKTWMDRIDLAKKQENSELAKQAEQRMAVYVATTSELEILHEDVRGRSGYLLNLLGKLEHAQRKLHRRRDDLKSSGSGT